MKSKVKLSRFATFITVAVTGILLGCCVFEYDDKPIFYWVLCLLLILLLSGSLYAPVSVWADADHIVIKSLLKSRKIAMADVKSVELFRPTMGSIRLCASGGYMGYWGLFRESDIGRYFACYGKASDCFLVILKNGDKYVLGCENPGDMVNYIKTHIG